MQFKKSISVLIISSLCIFNSFAQEEIIEEEVEILPYHAHSDEDDDITAACKRMAVSLCDENCIIPEKPGTGEYPDWWSQNQKNKEWNKRVELRKQKRIYDELIKHIPIYVNYCVSKEYDMKKTLTVQSQINRKVIEHENIFYNWNVYRLSQIELRNLDFFELEKDRDVFDRRYEYYKKHRAEKVRDSLSKFVSTNKKEKRLSVFDGRHKNIELQDEFLKYLVEDYTNFVSFYTARDKINKQQKNAEVAEKTFETLNREEMSPKEYEAYSKYMTLIKRKNDKYMESLLEKINIRVKDLEEM